MINLNESDAKPAPEANQSTEALQACQQEMSLWRDRCLRVTADFENYKKRAEKERTQWAKLAQSSILLDLLTIVDDFDRALNYVQANPVPEEAQPLIEGFLLTHKALVKLLQKYGVTEIEEHEIFDPSIHEATMQVDSPEHISGAIVAVLQKGYRLKDEVLRPAKVSVAK